MTRSHGRLFGLSFFILIALFSLTFTLVGGLSLHAVENCDHNYVEVNTFPATCTSEGGTTFQCTECSHTYIGNKSPMLDHKWETIAETHPTCIASGSITRRCTVCATEETTANGEAVGHNFSPDIVVPPTCSQEGYTYRICNTCREESEKTDITPTIDHTYEKHVTAEPTCQSTGTAQYVCTVCNDSYSEELPIVDHKFTSVVTPPTHDAEGYTTYTCDFCGMTKLDDFTGEKLPYDMVYTITEPTCTENGLKEGHCSDGCPYTESVILPATGHSFGEGENEGWTLVREATAELDGLEQRICTGCGLTESRTVAYIAPPDAEEPLRKLDPLMLVAIGFGLALLIGVTVAILLIILEHAGHKNTRKYALLIAVDKALEEEKRNQ